MTQAILGADIGVLIDDGTLSFILDRDTLAGTPVTPVRSYLGSDNATGPDVLLEAPVDQVVGTFVAIAVYYTAVSGALPRVTLAADSHGNDYEFGYSNGIALAWSRLAVQVDAGDFFTVSFDADVDALVAGVAFTGMAGSAFDVQKAGFSAGSTSPASGSFTTTGPSDVLIEVFTNIDLIAAHSLTLTDGGTVAGSVDGGPGSMRLASRIAGAAGSYNATGTWGSGAVEWAVLAVAFTPDTRSILHGDGSELTDISRLVLNVDVTWGARQPGGKLTDVEAGKATISILDVDRLYDPANLSSPVALNAGTFARIQVDGGDAFSGYLDRIEHTLADGVTTLTMQDAIPRLSQMATVVTVSTGHTDVQFAQVMTELAFTHYTILGSTTQDRDTEAIAMSAWAAFNRIRDAEGGQLYINRSGDVVFATRSYSASPAPRADIGDAPGTPLLDIVTVDSRDPIVNHIAIDMTDPLATDLSFQDDASVAHYGRRSLGWKQEDLLLSHPLVDYADLAAYIFTNMANGVGVTKLGSLIPEGTQIAELVCADFGDRFHVVDSYHGEPIDRNVETVGASWSVSYDGGWIVDLVTQDLP